VTRPDFSHFCELVWRPRNRIHAEEYHGVLYHSGLHRQALIGVDAEDGAEMTAAAQALGGAARFGLTGSATEPYLEPYTYSLEILERGFALIEGIAAAIELERHSGYDAASERPERPEGPSDLFAPETLRRIRCLSALDRARGIDVPRRPPSPRT
jgi:hypothetical protein